MSFFTVLQNEPNYVELKIGRRRYCVSYLETITEQNDKGNFIYRAIYKQFIQSIPHLCCFFGVTRKELSDVISDGTIMIAD